MCRAEVPPGGGQPQITATIIFPTLGTSYELPFIVDTGADITSLGKVASAQLGIHPDLAPPEIDIIGDSSHGVGGETDRYVIKDQTLLAFEEEHRDRDIWSLHIEHKPAIDVIPGIDANLLGRDIIDRFAMDYNPNEGYIEMERHDFGGGSYECHTYADQPTTRLSDTEEESEDGGSDSSGGQ